MNPTHRKDFSFFWLCEESPSCLGGQKCVIFKVFKHFLTRYGCFNWCLLSLVDDDVSTIAFIIQFVNIVNETTDISAWCVKDQMCATAVLFEHTWVFLFTLVQLCMCMYDVFMHAIREIIVVRMEGLRKNVKKILLKKRKTITWKLEEEKCL